MSIEKVAFSGGFDIDASGYVYQIGTDMRVGHIEDYLLPGVGAVERDELRHDYGLYLAYARGSNAGMDQAVAPTGTNPPTGASIKDNVIVVALSMLCCFPLGLFFVWTNPRWTTGQKGAWTALLIPIFMFYSCAQQASIRETEQTAQLLVEGDDLWDAGNRDAAAAKYRKAWTEHNSSMTGPMMERSKELVKPHLPKFYARLMEYELGKGNRAEAERLSRQAASDGITPSMEAEGKSREQALHDRVDELRQQLAEAQARIPAPDAAPLQQSQRVPVEAKTDVPAQRQVGEFTEDELDTIRNDPSLRIALELGHLNREKFSNFAKMKRGLERQDSFKGQMEYNLFLMMIPSKDWFEAAHKRGITKQEFRFATNFVFMTGGMLKAGELVDDRKYNRVLEELTGKTLEEY